MQRFVLSMFLTSLMVTLLNCGDSSHTTSGNSKLIKIVSSLPRQGTSKKQTDDIVNGIKLAFDEVGYKVGDYKLEYLDKDDASPQRGGEWDGNVEQSNAKSAIDDPDVMVYIGTYNSGAAKVSIPILNKANLLMVSPANTWPGLTKPGKGEPGEPEKYRPTGKINYCRVVPADDIQGPCGAVWAKKMGAKKVVVLHDRELYGKGIADLFVQHAKKIGLEVLDYQGIDRQAANYKSLATSIRGKNPDLVYFGGITGSNAGQLAKDLRSEGVKCPLMVPDGCFEKAFIDAAGADNVNGNTFATFGGVPAEKWEGKAKEFLERFKAKYNNPKPEPYTIYGYEAAKIVIEAIQKAGKKDRDAIRIACLSIKDFDAALGKWSFDENGDTTLSTMSGNVIRNGEWIFQEILKVE